MWEIFSLCWLFLSQTTAHFYKNNITDFSKCTVYYSRYGTTYKDFFNIQAPDAPSPNDTLLLDFHFSVLTASDAHILLAPSISAENQDPVYEIVIGAGGNTFCDIRRQAKSAVKASVRIKGLLSAVDIKSFWLHIAKDGLIEVGQEGEELAFISWTDPDPLPLNVFSFSTWRGIEAKWFFNCARDEPTEQVERNLTHLEQLRKDMLYMYDPYVRPVMNLSTLTEVSVVISTNRFLLDEKTSIIEVGGVLKLSWPDEKLIWDPIDYGDLEYMHIFRREIWRPDLYLYNSVGDGRDILGESMMLAHSTGVVEWNPPISVKAWCDARDRGDWPKDIHRCNLLFGVWQHEKSVLLSFDLNNSRVRYQMNSEWQILNVDIKTDDEDGTLTLIEFEVRRVSNIYNTIFFAPFIVISVCLLGSFWMSPFGHLKVALGCFQLVLSTIVLLSLAMFIPTHPRHVPYLLSLYSYSLVAGLICILLSIIVINLSRSEENYALPHAFSAVLGSKPMKFVLCLPKIELSEEYGKLNEGRTRGNPEQTTRILLGVAIDRVAFFVYLPLVFYAVYMNYKDYV